MRVRTLGGLALEGSELTRPQPLLLLAYVALEGPKGRRELADLFFMNTADPRDSLSTALRYLRKEAEGSVDLGDGTVACGVTCDAVELLDLLSEDRVEDAILLYDGTFLAGLDLSLDEELEEWVFETREMLARHVRKGLLDLAAEALNKGHVDRARECCESAMAVPGDTEPDHGDLTRAVSMLERVGSTQLEELRTLAEEQGVGESTPAAELPARAVGQIPQPRTTFVGRGAELDALSSMVGDERVRLVTIMGFGGIGKTRLAIELARRLTTEHAPSPPYDGTAFLSLDSVSSARDVLGHLGIALGVPPPLAYDIGVLAEEIGSDRFLLVLDNFEHLDPVDVGIAPLLDLCSGLQVVATSRRKLNVSYEHLFKLEGLPSGSGHHSGAIADGPMLFLDRARRFSPLERGSEHAETITRMLGGYPLGIELAASMLRSLPAEAVVRELESSFRVLQDGPADAPERHRSVRAAFQPSWRALDARDRDILLRLSVFASAFTPTAARHVAEAGTADLLRLTDQSMLGSEGGRFAFHPVLHELVREFSRDACDEKRTAEETYIAWAADMVRSCTAQVQANSPEVFDLLERELPNIVAAARLAVDRDESDVAIALISDLVVDCHFLSARGATDSLLDMLEDAIDLAEAGEDATTAHFLATRLGNAHRELLGDFHAARRAFELALELANRAGLRSRVAITLSLLAVTRVDLGESGATELLERARELAEDAGDKIALSHVLQNWSYVEGQGDDLERTLAITREAVTAALESKEASASVPLEVDQKLFFALLNLGEIQRHMGNAAQSLESRRRALDIARERDQALWAAFALEEIGTTHHQHGDRRLAETALGEALSLYRSAGASYQERSLASFAAAHGYHPRSPDRKSFAPSAS